MAIKTSHDTQHRRFHIANAQILIVPCSHLSVGFYVQLCILAFKRLGSNSSEPPAKVDAQNLRVPLAK